MGKSKQPSYAVRELPPLRLVIEGVMIGSPITAWRTVTSYRLQRVRDGRRCAGVEQTPFVIIAKSDGKARELAQTVIPQLLRRAQ